VPALGITSSEIPFPSLMIIPEIICDVLNEEENLIVVQKQEYITEYDGSNAAKIVGSIRVDVKTGEAVLSYQLLWDFLERKRILIPNEQRQVRQLMCDLHLVLKKQLYALKQNVRP
jgi:hypothetical protein